MKSIYKRASYTVPDTNVEHPFDNIALAFSGGGFRAATYALGVFSYLNELKIEDEKPLLSKVTYLSSASGGTITSALYALNNAEGKSFHHFYKSLFEKTDSINLSQKVFETLNDDDVWKNNPKSRNLINAYSIVYDKELFKNATLGHLKNKHESSHLQEVCFNATDFYRGLLFRQAVKMREDAKAHDDKTFLFGNFLLSLKHETAQSLRLGDLLAASSCFPTGFEPIIFPADFETGKNNLVKNIEVVPDELSHAELNFLYGESAVNELIKKLKKPFELQNLMDELKSTPLKKDLKIGLMDGGITDNQGIESMMRANSRRLDKQTAFKPFDFMLVNDVGSHFMEPYVFPEEKTVHTGFTSITIRWVLIIALITLLVSTLGLLAVWQSDNLLLAKIGSPITSFFLTASLFVLGLLFFLKNKVRKHLSSKSGFELNGDDSKSFGSKIFTFFTKTPISVLYEMVEERAGSMVTLNTSVFLNRIRQILYEQFFGDQKMKFRVKGNHIYDLSYSNDYNFKIRNSDTLKPDQSIQIVAQSAFTMPTTLWFDGKTQAAHTKAALIACGQFTTCFNLLEYVIRLKEGGIYSGLDKYYKDRLDKLETQLRHDYKAFNADPFILYNKIGNDARISGFKDCNISMIPFPKEFRDLR